MGLNFRKLFNAGVFPTYAHLFDSTAFRTPNLNISMWDKIREQIMPRHLVQIVIA